MATDPHTALTAVVRQSASGIWSVAWRRTPGALSSPPCPQNRAPRLPRHSDRRRHAKLTERLRKVPMATARATAMKPAIAASSGSRPYSPRNATGGRGAVGSPDEAFR